MHKSIEVKKSFVIISAERFTNTIEENKKNHLDLWLQLKRDGFSIKEVEGVYQGTSEKSIIVILNKRWLAVELATFKNYAAIFDQESILFVDEERTASLIFTKGGLSEKLGKFIAVPKGIATQMSNYTFDGQDHYVCDLRGA
tara:strand:+ start:454 stop:879 length:426 start_codon:yes stop_codon:yes gene_type:complete